jgi:hypothetical protein
MTERNEVERAAVISAAQASIRSLENKKKSEEVYERRH